MSIAVGNHKSDSGVENYSIRLDRSYKGEDGKFHSTPYLRDNYLLRVERLLQQVDERIEQDKGRQRGQASGQGR